MADLKVGHQVLWHFSHWKIESMSSVLESGLCMHQFLGPGLLGNFLSFKMLTLDTSHHAIRKTDSPWKDPCGEELRPLALGSSRHCTSFNYWLCESAVLEVDPPAPRISCPIGWYHMQQRWAFPAKHWPNWKLEINNYCSKPLVLGMVYYYTAIGNYNSLQQKKKMLR